MFGVKTFGLFARQVQHLGGNDAQTGIFKTVKNVTDQITANRIGLDDGKGAFCNHDEILNTVIIIVLQADYMACLIQIMTLFYFLLKLLTNSQTARRRQTRPSRPAPMQVAFTP